MQTAIDWRRAQARLGVTADGQPGPVTYAALLVRTAGHSVPLAYQLGTALAAHIPIAQLDATPARLAGFLGQCCHESQGFARLRETWGPTAAQRGYEGRLDLGNTRPGDGLRYLGRGLIQITGRANYARAGAVLSLPLIEQPALAELPETAVRTAIDFWTRCSLSGPADRCDWRAVTRGINGGLTALAERVSCVGRALAVLG